MRKALAAASAAFIGVSTAAYAADIHSSGSLKDEPAGYDVPKTWTGIYIGAGIGVGSVVHDLTVEVFDDDDSLELLGFDGIGGEGALGTLQVGYDRQLGSKFVLGVFADYDFSGISTEIDVFDGAFSADIDLDHMWSAGARFGWLATPDTMWYALVAYTNAEFDLSDLGLGDQDFDGWSVGLGAETRLTENWSLKGEYRFTQLDGESVFGIGGEGLGLDVDLEPSIHTGRVVLTYRINPFERSLDTYK